MAFTIGKLKCYFCQGKNGLLHSVCEYGIYGGVSSRIFYHPECLELVEINPEKFGHKVMDKALHIIELRELCIKQCNNNIIEVFNKKVEKLNTNHFERMMPNK